jgi:hypothetical protein
MLLFWPQQKPNKCECLITGRLAFYFMNFLKVPLDINNNMQQLIGHNMNACTIHRLNDITSDFYCDISKILKSRWTELRNIHSIVGRLPVLSSINWTTHGQYYTLSIEKSMDSIAQYPLKSLWTVLRHIHSRVCEQLLYNIHWKVCGQYYAIFIQESVDSITQCPFKSLWTVTIQNPLKSLWTVLRNIHSSLWTVLRNIHSRVCVHYCAISTEVCAHYCATSIEESVHITTQYPLKSMCTLLRNIHWGVCVHYYATSIAESVHIIAQYPLRSLCTLLRNIHWGVCVHYYAISIEESVYITVQYPLKSLWTLLRNIHWGVCVHYCAISIQLPSASRAVNVSTKHSNSNGLRRFSTHEFQVFKRFPVATLHSITNKRWLGMTAYNTTVG